MKKLKIAFVSPFPPGKATLNEYGFHLINHFKKSEEIKEIVILAEKLDHGKVYGTVEAKIPVKIIPTWSFNAWNNIVTILRKILKEKPDVVLFNIHFLSFGDKKIPAALALMIPMICRLLGIKTVVLLHNIIETVNLESAGITRNPLLIKMFGWIGTILTWFVLRANMVTVTISKYVKILEAKYKVGNVALVPHGSFEVPPLPDFNSADNKMTVMTFGKFGTYKKVEDLIKAVEILRKEKQMNVELVIAGTDSPNRIGYLDNVKERFSSSDFVRYTGYVEEEDVPKVFYESTVVVFPYTSTTGSSGVLHQAGCYGKACVLPNIGDLKILIEEEGYRGEYFEAGNIENLSEAIQKLLENENYRTELAKSNYAAAAGLPMSDIADWFILHFSNMVSKTSRTKKSFFSFSQEAKYKESLKLV